MIKVGPGDEQRGTLDECGAAYVPRHVERHLRAVWPQWACLIPRILHIMQDVAWCLGVKVLDEGKVMVKSFSSSYPGRSWVRMSGKKPM